MNKSSTLKLAAEFLRRVFPGIVFVLTACLVGTFSAVLNSQKPLMEALRPDFLLKTSLVTIITVFVSILIGLFWFIVLPSGLERSRYMLEASKKRPG
jgi:hypothetical protein